MLKVALAVLVCCLVQSSAIEADGCVHGGVYFQHGAQADMGCETCTCSNGVATCEGQCPDCEYKEEIYGHGKKWIDDCNACECLEHGTISCMLRQVFQCQNKCSFKGSTYSHLEVFDEDCNTCTCNARTVTCTQKDCGCTHEGVEYLNKQLFRDSCNACFCDEGKVNCSDHICL